MSTANDGGPAFPLQCIGPDFPPGHVGMTLRDYFAGQALAGWLASFSPDYIHPAQNDACAGVAADAYALADAMLAERAKGAAT